MSTNQIEFADVERLARAGSPDLADVIVAFLQQPDPVPEKAPPASAMSTSELRSALGAARASRRGKSHRRAQSTAAWKRFLAQTDPPPPPRFQLAALLLELYEAGGDTARGLVIDVAQRAPLSFGLWAGLKRIYKLAEERHDAQVFGVLAWRFDAESASPGQRDVSGGTLVYLSRRAWRFLRQLGAAVPLLYPQFAAEVLRHYTADTAFGADVGREPDVPRFAESPRPEHAGSA